MQEKEIWRPSFYFRGGRPDSHGIVQIAVKSPLDIRIPAARSRWNAQNAMQ